MAQESNIEHDTGTARVIISGVMFAIGIVMAVAGISFMIAKRPEYATVLFLLGAISIAYSVRLFKSVTA